MGIVIAVAAIVLALAGAAAVFLRADPRAVAATVRIAFPVGFGAAGIAILAAGRTGFGLLVLAVAGSLYMMFRRERPVGTLVTRHSLVRTAALEMELDHDTGRLEGLVLAGRSEGKMLGAMSLTDLGQLYQELAVDPDSRAERGYLDMLAGRLGLPDALVDHIEATVSSVKEPVSAGSTPGSRW